jgi:3-oxoacyl-[acyl-carrier protein] reductase
VNIVQPGLIATEMKPADGEFAAAAKQVTALGHYGDARDIASVVSFLAGRQSGFGTSATWNVDGGFSV